jgi:hypothetical protein
MVSGVSAALLALVATWALSSGAHQAQAQNGTARSLPLPRGAAWYSETLDTSPTPVAYGRQKPRRLLLQKWLTWQGDLFNRENKPGSHSDPGSYITGDSEPGFGDWDALDVHTLPTTPAGVMRLLQSGRLEAGQGDRAERRSPLIWLAQLAAMLADDPNRLSARTAAFKAIEGFPGLKQLGQVRDPQGRLGVAVAEQAGNLHPLIVATGPGCHNPNGGAGCIGVATPKGAYQLELIFDPTDEQVLAVRTIAASNIPTAWIKPGETMYEVSYLKGQVITHPDIPAPPTPNPPTIQSVPWHLANVNGRKLTVNWESGTCDPSLKPRPRIRAVGTGSTVTLTVLVDVVTGKGNTRHRPVSQGRPARRLRTTGWTNFSSWTGSIRGADPTALFNLSLRPTHTW